MCSNRLCRAIEAIQPLPIFRHGVTAQHRRHYVIAKSGIVWGKIAHGRILGKLNLGGRRGRHTQPGAHRLRGAIEAIEPLVHISNGTAPIRTCGRIVSRAGLGWCQGQYQAYGRQEPRNAHWPTSSQVRCLLCLSA